ncbi:MAG: glycoside hydrolase family 172 protein, partial [Planctomycetota bacterium]
MFQGVDWLSVRPKIKNAPRIVRPGPMDPLGRLGVEQPFGPLDSLYEEKVMKKTIATSLFVLTAIALLGLSTASAAEELWVIKDGVLNKEALTPEATKGYALGEEQTVDGFYVAKRGGKAVARFATAKSALGDCEFKVVFSCVAERPKTRFPNITISDRGQLRFSHPGDTIIFDGDGGGAALPLKGFELPVEKNPFDGNLHSMAVKRSGDKISFFYDGKQVNEQPIDPHVNYHFWFDALHCNCKIKSIKLTAERLFDKRETILPIVPPGWKATGGTGAQHGFGGLLNEMTDRDRLAVFPAAARYRLSQVSSTDTGVSALGRPSTFSNHDWQGNQRLSKRVEKNPEDGVTEIVLMEDTGPGAIVRWWLTTNGTRGEVRIYLDGSAKPVLQGQVRPFVGANPAFGKELSFRSRPSDQAGHNLYAPIPYAKSAKVTFRMGTLGAQFYYAINYREYEDGTVVKTYSPGDVTANAQTLLAARTALGTPTAGGHIGSRKEQSATLAAGKAIAHDLAGTGAIRRIALKVTGADQVAALRNTWIELTFDGQQTARVPAGHFFGNGDSDKDRPYNAHEDFYRTVAADGALSCRWVMPHKTSARVRVVNEGEQNVDVVLEVDSGKWTWDKNSMHFHADFREEAGIKTRHGVGTADFRFLTARGRGVYVGDTLSVNNPVSTGWWGEGDEKVYVDYLDEKGAGHGTGPNHLGTGTEDYYGYAWGHVEKFKSAFVGQSKADGVAFRTWQGRIVNTRVRGLDAIPFGQSLKFDMEILHWAAARVDFAATTYWYGAPGASAMRAAADLQADYKANHDFAKGGIADTAGDGRWLYMTSDNVNPSAAGARTAFLKYGNVGD